MVLAAARPAGAQPLNEDSDPSGDIAEVIVTAQRREESAQDVPLSMSIYSDDFIERSTITTAKDLALYAPNLTISSSSQQTNLRIGVRGVASVGNNAIEPSVGVFVDGVYYPRPGSVIGDLLDVQRIEVLRGPQGTLFGRNTPVGALNITTHNPTNEKEARVEFGIGTRSLRVLDATISGPLSDGVAGRISGRRADRDGFGFNEFDGRRIGERDSTSVRGKLRIDVSPDFEITVVADGSRVRTGGPTIEVLTSTSTATYDNTLGALFGASATTGDSFDRSISQDHRDHLDDDQWGVAVDGIYSFSSGASLRFITSTRDWQADVLESVLRLPANVLPRTTSYATDTLAQDIQFASPLGEQIDYVAGLYLYQEDYAIDQAFDAGSEFCVPVIFALTLGQTNSPAIAQAQAQSCLAQPQERFISSAFEQSLRSSAIYGQMTWNASDLWSYSLGGRYTRDAKNGSFVQQVSNTFGLLFRPPESSVGLDRNDSEFTWFASAERSLSDDMLLFATLSTGFKSGGFNSEGAGTILGTAARTYAPENSSNLEVGVKSQLLNKQLTANVSVFRTELRDFQDRTFDGLSFFVRNVGKLRQQGIEADLTATPTDSLRLFGGLAYLDSKFLSFPNGSPLPGGTVPQDLAGTRTHYSPEWKASLVAEWGRVLGFGDGMALTLRTEWQYTGQQNIGSSTNNNPQTVQQGFSLFNASVVLSPPRADWQLKLFGKNLLDEGYCEAMFEQPIGNRIGAVDPINSLAVQRCAVGSPRLYGISVSLSF